MKKHAGVVLSFKYLTSPTIARNIMQMFLRKLLTITFSVVLAGSLVACSTAGSLLTDASDNASVSTTNGLHHRSQNDSVSNGSDSDNDATLDYFHDASSVQNSHNNLWVAIREDFQLNHYANNPDVQAQLNWFMHNQDYLDRTARRAAPYMYYIYQAVKARNLPSELVLLPIIESAYNPFVSSPMGAAGLWQIEPGTAHTFGLREDFWYDGRRDVTASTNAALDYLSYLQNYFGGDWLLAIAAYDTGEGNVASSIHRNARNGLATDYWSLSLAQETEAYVPRLLALAIIISDPKDYPVNLPAISNQPYLGEVEISSQISLAQAATMAGVSITELKTLNPEYRRSTLDPHEPYKLLLPLDRVSIFKHNLLALPTNQGGLWSRYKVQPGDTWNKIAKRFNTSIGLIQEVNRLTNQQPPVGEILLIPENQNNEAAIATAVTHETNEQNSDTDNSSDGSIDTSISPSSNTNSDAPVNNTFTSNDSDDNTANNNDDVTVAAPDLSDAANLDASAMKSLDAQNAKNTESPSGLHLYKIIHTVKPGETITSIAQSHHVSAEEVARWNNLSSIHTHVKHGSKIVIWHKNSSSTHSQHVKNPQNISHHKTNANDTTRLRSSNTKHLHHTVAQLEKKHKMPNTTHTHNA
jgi:membrane-bound lytic murein transglycosylase D